MKVIDTDALVRAVRATLRGQGPDKVRVTTPDPLEKLALTDFRRRLDTATGDVAAIEVPTTSSVWG